MNDLSLPAVHAEPGADLHRSLAAGVRGPLYRAAYNGRRETRVSQSRQDRKRGYLRGSFEDAGLEGNPSPFSQRHQALRNVIAAVMESALFEFRDDLRRAIAGRVGKRSLKTVEKIAMTAALGEYAGRWISGTGQKPFGFEWCCLQLDQNPERVRAAILGRAS